MAYHPRARGIGQAGRTDERASRRGGRKHGEGENRREKKISRDTLPSAPFDGQTRLRREPGFGRRAVGPWEGAASLPVVEPGVMYRSTVRGHPPRGVLAPSRVRAYAPPLHRQIVLRPTPSTSAAPGLVLRGVRRQSWKMAGDGADGEPWVWCLVSALIRRAVETCGCVVPRAPVHAG